MSEISMWILIVFICFLVITYFASGAYIKGQDGKIKEQDSEIKQLREIVQNLKMNIRPFNKMSGKEFYERKFKEMEKKLYTYEKEILSKTDEMAVLRNNLEKIKQELDLYKRGKMVNGFQKIINDLENEIISKNKKIAYLEKNLERKRDILNLYRIKNR